MLIMKNYEILKRPKATPLGVSPDLAELGYGKVRLNPFDISSFLFEIKLGYFLHLFFYISILTSDRKLSVLVSVSVSVDILTEPKFR